MLSQLRAFLAHFGEVAHADASHFAAVVKADWDALVAKLADEPASTAKGHLEATLAASSVVHDPATGTVGVQLPAGGLHVLSTMADGAGTHEIVSTVNGLRAVPAAPAELVPAPAPEPAPSAPDSGDHLV